MNPDPRTTDDMFMMEVEVLGEREDLEGLLKETGAVELQ